MRLIVINLRALFSDHRTKQEENCSKNDRSGLYSKREEEEEGKQNCAESLGSDN
jgi:hypothetical protein